MSHSALPKANLFGAFVLRIALGFYFFLLGLWSYLEPEHALQNVREYAELPSWLASGIAGAGPYLFFACGAGLIVGLFTRVAAIICAVLLLPLLFGAGVFSPQGDRLVYFLEQRSLYRDAVLLAGCISLSLTGAGAISADRMLQSLYAKRS